MARPRRNQSANVDSKNNKDKTTNSSSSNGSAKTKHSKNQSTGVLFFWKHIVGFSCLAVAIGVGYVGYLETRVNTPYDDKKMVVQSGLDVPERFWGTYRPGLYFGLKTRDPRSLNAGLMWYFPKRLGPGGNGIRHWCEQSDNLDKYGWLKHDGIDFGVQQLQDGPYLLKTSFVKRPGGDHGGEWTARISVDYKRPSTESEQVSLLWYTALDDNAEGFIKPSNMGSQFTGVRGATTGLGEFAVKLFNHSGIIEHESYLSTVAPGLHLLRETVIQSLRLTRDGRRVTLAGELLSGAGGSKALPNFIVTQLTARVPFTLDIVFESGSNTARPNELRGDIYTRTLTWHESRFEQRFQNTFNLKQKGYDKEAIDFAQAAISNMLGGIGYFYGTSRVKSVYTKEPVPYWKAPLYTGVPSRSFFPRGFLWDEGFHGLLIAAWDVDIQLDIMCHWFDLMNVEGWIPREQILGAEALAKVPEEFVTQSNTNANPPTFFLTLNYILDKFKDRLDSNRLLVFQRLYPRLQAWFSWFNTTQKGLHAGTYRWRGRDALTNRELNPKTLTSGLDDYPRASHPTDDERHVDLRCWIALAADVLYKLSNLLGRDGHKYYETARFLSDNALLNELHWSKYTQAYADFGLHTDDVVLKRPKLTPRSQMPQNLEMVRVTLKAPEYRHVDSSFGYVSLFPLLLQILEPNSLELNKTLTDLRNPNLLWTNFGLRSLAQTSPMYMKRNTEHDPPYWRGQIWININYLATVALHHYSTIEGPFKEIARQTYKELRKNIVDNVLRQYLKSGYVWEQYNDRTGEGSGCRPFTGWSALVVTLMGENF